MKMHYFVPWRCLPMCGHHQRRSWSLGSHLVMKRRWFSGNKQCLVPSPSWSLNDLQLSTKMTKSIVSDEDIESLCKLSCIDLKYSKTSIQSVVDDINVILRCADSIKDNSEAMGGNERRLFTDNTLEMETLRDDLADNISYKEVLLSRAQERKEDYYSVPNVNSKKHDSSK
mmetsp:Transcript_26263/g.49275  ORF Transcript_26263/g.49275 Transcript_26263/m.49275 type:complete len:171 (+) Transcript_26263:93-605(+)